MKRITYITSGLAMMSLFACKSQKDLTASNQVEFPSFSSEAHRGGRGLMPENTIAAMKNAIDLGITTLEMDTHITGDKQVVVSHDDYLSSQFILKPNGEKISKAEEKSLIIYKMNYADLRKYDVGSKFHDKFPEQKKMKAYIPLLEDLIDSVQTYIKQNNKKQLFYNIETKCDAKGDGVYNPEPAEFVKLLMDVVMKKKIAPYVVIQSFDKRTIQLINQKYPGIRTSYLVNNKKSVEENLAELGFKPFIYSPEHKLVTAELVAKVHAQQIKVIPWTANTKADIQRLKDLKVDGIITDYPDLLVD